MQKQQTICFPLSYDCTCNPSSFLKKLQQTLSDISEELQLTNSRKSQLEKLVGIITDERNYYQQQLTKSESERRSVEEQLSKLKHEQNSKNLLVSELKKENRRLSEQTQTLMESLEETKFLFDAQQQQIDRIRKEKNLIQTEWNKVIKQVSAKMNRMKRKQHEEQKQNMEILANLPLKERVSKVLQKIDRQIKEEEAVKATTTNTLMRIKETPTSSSFADSEILQSLNDV